MFAKIQFLEGIQRKEFFAKYPPKTVYVFSKRVNPLRNGMEVDEKGKPWASTMCFAWFVWELGYTGVPSIKVPSDGLCGKTDEDNLGFTYTQLDDYIMYGTSGSEDVDAKILTLHLRNLHKLSPMPTCVPI